MRQSALSAPTARQPSVSIWGTSAFIMETLQYILVCFVALDPRML